MTYFQWYDELTIAQRQQVRTLFGEGYEAEYLYTVENGQVVRRRRKAQRG